MKSLSSQYLVYHERVKTTRVYIRDATPVSPYALMLFGGGEVDVEEGEESVIRLDGWLGFRCPRRDHQLIMELRGVLAEVLKRKIETPSLDFSEEASGVVEAVKAILTMDAKGGVMAKERVGRGGSGRGDRRDEAMSAFEKLKQKSNGGGGKSKSSKGGSR